MLRQITLTLLVFAVGCSSFGRKFDADRAKQIHKVAILSFEVQQQQPTDNLGFSKLKEIKSGRPGDSAELKSMANRILESARSEMAQKTGWRIVETKAVKAGPTYSLKYKDATSGLHGTSFTDGQSEIILADGILDNSHFRRMDHAERAKLAKELGVDAFAEIMIYERIEQSRFSIGHLTGDAAFAFVARSNLQVYGLDSDDPIWRVQNVDGETSAESSTLPEGTSKLERLAKLGEEAARSSLDKLFGTFKAE